MQRHSQWISRLLAGLCLAALLSAGAGVRAYAQDASAASAAAATQRVDAPQNVAGQDQQTAQKSDADSAEDEVNVYRHSPMVQTLAHLFGQKVETTARIFEFVNFLILAIAVLWFLARALPKALRGRAERIQKNLQEARRATEDASRRLQEVEQRLSRLDEEIAAMRMQTEGQTAADEARIRAAMEAEKMRLVRAAEQEVQSASVSEQRKIQALAAGLIYESARKNLTLDAEADRALVQGFVAELDSKANGKGVN
jgi:F-type H+-transporting ATPase subunit b